MGSFLAANLADGLFEFGEWEACDRVLAEALERETTAAPSRCTGSRGSLRVVGAPSGSARHHLELARRLNPAPFIVVWPLASLAELAIWQGRHDDARAAVDEGMGVLWRLQAGQDEPDPAFKRLGMRFWVLGLRAAADRAELARAKRSAAGAEEARQRAERLVGMVAAVTGHKDRRRIPTWMVSMQCWPRPSGPGWRDDPTRRRGSGPLSAGSGSAPVCGSVCPFPAGGGAAWSQGAAGRSSRCSGPRTRPR